VVNLYFHFAFSNMWLEELLQSIVDGTAHNRALDTETHQTGTPLFSQGRRRVFSERGFSANEVWTCLGAKVQMQAESQSP
jgi:hypothetical protein